METPQLTRLAEKQVAGLLADRNLPADRLIARLRELGAREGVAACSAAMRMLARLEIDEEEGERLLGELVGHRQAIASVLDRDPGLQVAAIDYLTNVRRMLDSPAVIELDQLEETERGAMTDSLTSLFNRRCFHQRLDAEIRRGRRHTLSLSLLMLDLDYFKSVNDIYGHTFGDRVLRRAGRLVRRAVRESDVACRYGGDELVVILPETDRLGAFIVADRVRATVEAGFTASPLGDRLVAMTLSGGVATFPEDGTTPEALIDCADRALYQAKSRGRNGVVIHHAERRRAVRFPVRPSTRVEVAPGSGASLAAVQAINLSRTGVLLESVDEPPSDGAIELTLWEEERQWSVPGRVVRVEDPVTPAGRRQFAVAFDQPLADSCLRQSVLYVPRQRAVAGDRL